MYLGLRDPSMKVIYNRSPVISLLHESKTISQQYYARYLKAMANNGTFEKFRRQWAIFPWLTNIGPDISGIANQAAKVTEKTFVIPNMSSLHKA